MRTVWLASILVALSGCSTPPATAPSLHDDAIDVLPYLVGDPMSWPRQGTHWQHQVVDWPGNEVCWVKYGNPSMFECWRWDDRWVYHAIDHGLDGGQGGSYRLTDGRWLPRFLPRGGWQLDVSGNQIREFDRMCREDPATPRSFPYRLRAWHEGVTDAGGDVGVRDVLVLEYRPYDPVDSAVGMAERFYFARGAGWYLWKRADGAGSLFNRRGGSAVAGPLSACVWR